jgi:hypothetical protein
VKSDCIGRLVAACRASEGVSRFSWRLAGVVVLDFDSRVVFAGIRGWKGNLLGVESVNDLAGLSKGKGVFRP